MLLKRALALALVLDIAGAAPGLTPYAALAAERALPDGARPAAEGAPAPLAPAVALPALSVPVPGLDSQAAAPEAGAPAAQPQAELAPSAAQALSPESPVSVAPAVGAALEQAAASPAEAMPAASGPAAWLGRVFDNLRRRKAASEPPTVVEPSPADAAGSSAEAAALAPSSGHPAPANPTEPPAPGSSFDGIAAHAARNVTWWLRPTAALVGALWLQKAAAAEGLAASLHSAAGLSPAALWSTLIVASLTAALYAAPRAALQALRRLSPAPTGAEKAQTAAAFAVGALVATALQAPFGWGLPSMLLMGGSIAAILAWAASIRWLAPAPERAANSLERSAGVVGFAVAAAVPAALALDIFGWLPFSTAWLLTILPAAVLLLDMILAAPVRLYRAVVPAPTDPLRRGVLSGLSATGLASIAVGGGLPVAAALGPDFDRKLGHFHADEGSSYHYWDERADETAASLPSWEDLRAAAERLKQPLEPDAAVAQARILSNAVGPYADGSLNPEYQKWLHTPGTFDSEGFVTGRPDSKKKPLSEEQRLWLIDFVLDPQVVHSPSAAARELVLDAKRKAIDALIDRESAEPNLASREALKALWSYSERIDQPDPTYPRFGFTEQERLTLGVKAHYYDILPHYQTKEGDAMSRRYRDLSDMLRKWLTRDTLAAEMAQQRAMDKERAAPLHSLPLSRVKRARDYRAWPKDVLAAVSEAARAHGIPEELLIVNLGTQIERQYTLREGFDVWAQRQDEKTSSGRLKVKIAKWLSDKMPAGVAMPVRWNDFLGGMILNGKNGIGLFQIRPANVRRYPWVWKRFGVPDADALSDREITWRLHDPRYNAEAWACILEGMAQDVDNLRLKASRGEKLDFSTYEKESKTWLTPSDDKVYALLPTLDSVPGRWWRLTAFHPLLRDKAGMDVGDAGTLLASGALDGRPATLTNIRSLDDVKDAAKLLSGDDAFFADAARRGLTAVAAGASGPEVAKAAAEALAKASQKTASIGLPAGLAAAAGALAANPTLSRRGLLGIGATGNSHKDDPKK